MTIDFDGSISNDAKLNVGLVMVTGADGTSYDQALPIDVIGCDESCNGDKCEGYRGCRAKTASGKACRPWKSTSTDGDEVTSSKYPGRGLDGGHNYCRNPNDESFLWCYTGDAITSKELCGISEYFLWKSSTHCSVAS